MFFGEGGLDLTDIINEPAMIAFWGEGKDSDAITYYGEGSKFEDKDPLMIQNIDNPSDYFVDPDLFISSPGQWYLWDGENRGKLAFIVKEPEISLNIWDETIQKDITNKEVKQGNFVNFLIQTNMWSIINRVGYTPEDAPFSLIMEGPDGQPITHLIGNDGQSLSLKKLPVNSQKWFWAGEDDNHTDLAPKNGWDTGSSGDNNDVLYKRGEYQIQTRCNLNGMFNLYVTPDGSEYTGKTASVIQKLNINGENIENVNKDIVNGETREFSDNKPVSEEIYIKIDNTRIGSEPNIKFTGVTNLPVGEKISISIKKISRDQVVDSDQDIVIMGRPGENYWEYMSSVFEGPYADYLIEIAAKNDTLHASKIFENMGTLNSDSSPITRIIVGTTN